jgi:hypothetical protein
MNKFFKDIFTEDCGEAFCMARVLAFLAMITFTICAIIHVLHNPAIDLNQLGIGLAATLTGAGAAIGAKAITQKDS